MNHILTQLGQAKLSYSLRGRDPPPGQSLRVAAGAVPSRPEPEQPKRVTAARIIADVAQPRATGELNFLLSDPNPAVRFQAAQALKRLTGNDQGRPPEQWQADPWTACEPCVSVEDGQEVCHFGGQGRAGRAVAGRGGRGTDGGRGNYFLPKGLRLTGRGRRVVWIGGRGRTRQSA